MRKLLHLVFAISESGRPFDPEHYPWPTPAHVETSDNGTSAKEQLGDNGLSRKARPRATSRTFSRQSKWSPRPVPTA